jgi:heterotetrameric sarcosine oxidase delta subunit
MLLIHCPWCGPREEVEFHYGGQADVSRPAAPLDTDDVTWSEYLFVRANPKGMFAERWSHSAGCRRWFAVLRDTVTNEITDVRRFDGPVPR